MITVTYFVDKQSVKVFDQQRYNLMGNCNSEQIETPVTIRKIDIKQSHLEDQRFFEIPKQTPKAIISQSHIEGQVPHNIPKQVPNTIIPQSKSQNQVPLNITKQTPKTIIPQVQLKAQVLINAPYQVPEQIVSAQAQAKVQLLMSKFSVCNYVSQLLDGSQNGTDGVAYTRNQAMDLSKALIEGIIQLETKQSHEQRSNIQELFDNDNIQLIKQQKLYYYGMLEKYNKKDEQINQNSKSRIYHKIANLKKQNPIKNQWANKYKIQCIKSNDYKLLSQEQLDDVVRCEAISDHVLNMGEKINFKFESIKRQSKTILEVLSKVMADHNEQINNLKYDLNLQEVMKMAFVSRNACKYYDNGVFVLLSYFVQSCKRLQGNGKSSQAIEKLLFNAIENISKLYPPGQGLSKENQFLINNLKQLEVVKQGKFSHAQIPMKPTNKQAQVQEIIVNYAKIAEQCKDLFELLVKSTCIQRAVLFKIGLKLYPKNPNKKAMTRIKEKMFFAKDQKGEKQMTGSIKQILAQEETNYRKIIDELLEKSTAVPFKISDMVRGKCVFLEVSDIIETVKQIKDFVRKDSRFSIQEIESRFTNVTPISDVTLKIVINNKIVAELQLTIQTNAAAYNFAHKIYQLQRTKVFSKLKIIHNYFQESNDDFSQLAYKAIKLLDSKSIIPKNIVSSISKYFKLELIKDKSFRQILPIAFQQKKTQLQTFNNVVNPLLQDLMLSVFEMETGVWYKQLGKIIDGVLKNQSLSPKLKSVLISCFLDKFQLPKESEYMQQCGFTDQQLGYGEKIFMEGYIKEYFSIEKIFDYTNQNQRVFHRAEQLKEIKFSKYYPQSPIQLRDSRFVINIIIGQHCSQIIKKLIQIYDFYFVTRANEKDQFCDQFSCYYNWINTELKQNESLDKEGLLRSQIVIKKAQQQLQYRNPAFAIIILEQAKKIFKNKEKQEKIIQCDILLTECFIKEKKQSLEKSINRYNTELVKKALALGLQLKGALYADAMWRISEHLWGLIQDTNGDEKKMLLDSFTKIAIRQMSRSKGKNFIFALKQKWSQFSNNGLEQCQILENGKVEYVKLYELGSNNCYYLTLAKWVNLKKINLTQSKLVAADCAHLIKCKWENLTHLDISMNTIGDEGCEYLSSVPWNSLTHLSLGDNKISEKGCLYLINGKWDNLTYLNLWNNCVYDRGCRHLSGAKLNKLTQLNLSNNSIGFEGCQYLTYASWENLTQLNLRNNSFFANEKERLKPLIMQKFTKLSKQWAL